MVSLARVAASALVVGLCFGAAPQAFAHAHLKSVQPAVDGTVAVAPPELVMSFTEALEPKFSKIEVVDAAGKRVDKADLHLGKDNAKQLAVGLTALAAVRYTVIWHAVSVDTHTTDGKFDFQVKP